MKQFDQLDLTDKTLPCKSIQKVIYEYEELKYLEDNWVASNQENDTFFKVLLEFADTSFMEIKHVRAYGLQSLIGNSGGYLGLFTGYALLQLPMLVDIMCKGIYKMFIGKHKAFTYDVEAS